MVVAQVGITGSAWVTCLDSRGGIHSPPAMHFFRRYLEILCIKS